MRRLPFNSVSSMVTLKREMRKQKMTIISRILTTTLLIISFTATGQANPANLPAIKQIELSPDGTRCLSQERSKITITPLRSTEKQKKQSYLWHRTGNFSLNWCKWANNKKIIYSGSGTVETKARDLIEVLVVQRERWKDA